MLDTHKQNKTECLRKKFFTTTIAIIIIIIIIIIYISNNNGKFLAEQRIRMLALGSCDRAS
jgi:hypothetical protein